MSSNKIFEALIYYSKDFKSKFGQKLSITILELLYYLIRPFSPEALFRAEDNSTGLQEAIGKF